VLSWTHPGDAFVLMLAFDQPVGVPPEYADLLPLPWSEIESRVRKGELVEAQGKARNRTVIILAAPTSGQLDDLVRRTHLLDVFRTDAPEEGKTPAGDQGAGGGALVDPGHPDTAAPLPAPIGPRPAGLGCTLS
jgi:hypothetical protein